MGFRKDSYAKVFGISEGKYNTMSVRLAISRKRKDVDPPKYEQEFSGFCTFIGNAKAKAEKLREGDRIRLGDIDVTNNYDKEKDFTYHTYKVFDFEFVDDVENSTTEKTGVQPDGNPEDGESDEERLPF